MKDDSLTEIEKVKIIKKVSLNIFIKIGKWYIDKNRLLQHYPMKNTY